MELLVPQILIPKFIAAEDDRVGFKMGVWGEYEIIKRTKGLITQKLKFKNIITDVGLNNVANAQDQRGHGQYCFLGTGTAVPVSTDTTLQACGTTYKSGSLSIGGSGADFWQEWTFNYALAEVIGTWTEVGVSWLSTANPNVFSRSLIKDTQGNTVQVQKTADDTLTIVYRLHWVRASDTPFSNVVALTGGAGNITVESLVPNACLNSFAGNSDYCFGRVPSSDYSGYKLGNGVGALSPTRVGLITPLSGNASLVTVSTYVAGTRYRDFTIEWPASIIGTITEAQAGIIKRSINDTIGTVTFRFVEGIVKDNTKKLRLGFRASIDRTS